MQETPGRQRGEPSNGTSMSFFAIANLYTIEEGSRGSKSTTSNHSSMVLELSSTHSEGLTALPTWQPRLERINSSRIQSPRVQSPVQFPKRSHTRQASQDPILAKEIHATETAYSNRSGASTPADKDYCRPSRRPSRMMLLLVLAIVVVLSLAIILGAVLGTFVSGHSNSTPQPEITAIPAGATPTPTSTGLSGNSSPQRIPSLAVTGWNVPGDSGYYTVWLFSQDADGYLSRHTFNSSTGNWTRVTNFTPAKPGTPLAAASFTTEYYANQPNYTFLNSRYQSEVVYLNNDNDVNEWIFPDSGPAVGQPGSINQQKYIAHPQTNIAFSWPSIVYQGMSGEIREARFECLKRNECWNDLVLNTSEPANGTRLVTVPTGNNLSSAGVFYQEEGGRFVDYEEDSSSGTASLWTNQAFSNRIPQNSSVAAFATTRTEDSNALNTYILWQDTNGTIQMSWTQDEMWRGPITHPAFSGANKGTALACLTGLTFPGFPLRPGTELSRCYFQVGTTIREVTFDGVSWDVVGVVPTFNL